MLCFFSSAKLSARRKGGIFISDLDALTGINLHYSPQFLQLTLHYVHVALLSPSGITAWGTFKGHSGKVADVVLRMHLPAVGRVLAQVVVTVPTRMEK